MLNMLLKMICIIRMSYNINYNTTEIKHNHVVSWNIIKTSINEK